MIGQGSSTWARFGTVCRLERVVSGTPTRTSTCMPEVNAPALLFDSLSFGID